MDEILSFQSPPTYLRATDIQDVVSTLSPDEWSGIFVVRIDGVVDGFFQSDDTGLRPTRDPFFAELLKESLHQIEARRRCRREMNVTARVRGEYSDSIPSNQSLA